MDKNISEVYMDDLIETAIGIDPAAMYHLLNRMEIGSKRNEIRKDVEQMDKNLNEIYMDDLIETAIGIDPAAMYQLLNKMEISLSADAQQEVKKMDRTISEEYLDDLIETAIGVDPAAMYQLMNQMDIMIERPERDPAFAAYVDELVCGIDDQIKEYFTNLSPDWDLKNNADLKLKSSIEINSNTIYELLNRMEERLENTERNLAEFRKKEEIIYAAVI